MRYYLPGIGRFVSRVHLHEAVALGRTTYEELREEWGITIGPLGTPEAFARNGRPEHLYTYSRNNPAAHIDPGGLHPIPFTWHLPGGPRWHLDCQGRGPQRHRHRQDMWGGWNSVECLPQAPTCAQAVAKKYGDLLQTAVNDKFKHCVVACKIVELCGSLDAVAASIWKEIMDLIDRDPRTHAEWADLVADYKGMKAAICRPSGDCAADCGKVYDPKKKP